MWGCSNPAFEWTRFHANVCDSSTCCEGRWKTLDGVQFCTGDLYLGFFRLLPLAIGVGVVSVRFIDVATVGAGGCVRIRRSGFQVGLMCLRWELIRRV